ncbi:MAG: hypothetical protein WC028_14840 [Candidatus Obscuribacterales bacterium]
MDDMVEDQIRAAAYPSDAVESLFIGFGGKLQCAKNKGEDFDMLPKSRRLLNINNIFDTRSKGGMIGRKIFSKIFAHPFNYGVVECKLEPVSTGLIGNFEKYKPLSLALPFEI